MKYLALILLFLTLSNTNTCKDKNKKTASHEPKEVQETPKNKFFITTLYGKDISAEKLYITFDEASNSASGYAGCNSFSCTYTIEKEVISFGYPMTSKMYCEKKAAVEKEFFQALRQTTMKIIRQDSLFLKDTNKETLFLGIKSKE